MLTRVFYVSEVAPGVTDVDMQVVLGIAQVNNRRLDVTGMLVQSDSHFAQVLEGRAHVVAALMDRIRADARHVGVRVLLQEPIVTRQFARWAMGLIRRDDMVEEMRLLHRDGCADEAAAHAMIASLTAR
jgi:hypothetical protein